MLSRQNVIGVTVAIDDKEQRVAHRPTEIHVVARIARCHDEKLDSFGEFNALKFKPELVDVAVVDLVLHKRTSMKFLLNDLVIGLTEAIVYSLGLRQSVVALVPNVLPGACECLIAKSNLCSFGKRSANYVIAFSNTHVEIVILSLCQHVLSEL